MKRLIALALILLLVGSFGLEVGDAAAQDAEGNRPPEVVGSIPDQVLIVGDSVVIDLSQFFRDPEGDPIVDYGLYWTNPEVARGSSVAPGRGALTLHGRQIGTTEVLVVACDVSSEVRIRCSDENDLAFNLTVVGSASTHTSTPTPVPTSTPTPMATPVPTRVLTPTATAWAQAPADTVESDRVVLVALHRATDGPNWVNSVNWLSDAPLGSWYGVTTDNSGRVVSVHLGGNGLRGRIPAELSNLTNLRELSLSYNQLTGAIPPQLAALAYLQRFVLFYNYLSGPIPPELGSLANLESLILSNNRLSGHIPPELAGLSNLKRLELDNNQIGGALPGELGSLVNLTVLLVDRNLLNGEIPHSLTALSEMERFYFQNNDGLCAPPDAAIQEWLSSISDKWGKSCSGLTIRSVPTPDPFDAALAVLDAQLEAEWAQTPTPEMANVVPVQSPSPIPAIAPTPRIAPASVSAPSPTPEIAKSISAPAPAPTPTPAPQRGFFTNSVPSPDGVEAGLPFDIMDPVTLSLIGVLLTLGATTIQLFRGK